jgi:hypothetical protein
MRRATPIRELAGALQGRPPNAHQWRDVLELANRTWVTPAVFLALRAHGRLDAIPDDVRDFLAFIHERNVLRNRRLRAQLVEAVRALNGAGVEPVLLKGAIALWGASEDELGRRMMNDLDLSVGPQDTERAEAALLGLGYAEAVGVRGFGRTDNPGLIEIRDKPSPRARPYLSGDILAGSERREREGCVARLPSATAQALHLIVHDMLKEGDLWRWSLDFRHLHDLWTLASRVDWLEIDTRLADRPGRRALDLQVMALADLFGFERSATPLARNVLMTRLRHHARLTTAAPGRGGRPVQVLGNLNWGVRRWRAPNAYRFQGCGDFVSRVWTTLIERPKGALI